MAVGDCVTLVFENHDTVFFQIHEMLRAEHITDIDAVREELDVYNALLPHARRSQCHHADRDHRRGRRRGAAARVLGIDECLFLEIGGERLRAEFEAGRSREDKLSAVQYVRFALPQRQRAAFLDSAVPACLVIDHPHYRAVATLAGETRASLQRDIGEPS